MKYNKIIDFKKEIIDIEKNFAKCKIILNRKNIFIDRLQKSRLIVKQKNLVSIDRLKYKVVRVNVFIDKNFVNLQNDFLPIEGEYFLN